MEKKAIANPFATLYLAYTSGSQLTGDAVAAGLALAALAGGGAGFLASKLSSPGKRDFKNIQREFVRDKLQKEVNLGQRESALEDMRAKALPKPPKPKSIRL